MTNQQKIAQAAREAREAGLSHGEYSARTVVIRQRPAKPARQLENEGEPPRCEKCGKVLTGSRRGGKKYCDAVCSAQAHSQKYYERKKSGRLLECPICKREFRPVSQYQIYCSDGCIERAAQARYAKNTRKRKIWTPERFEALVNLALVRASVREIAERLGVTEAQARNGLMNFGLSGVYQTVAEPKESAHPDGNPE